MSASFREPSCKTCGIIYYADRPGICDCTPPYRPPMNYQERARRAEALAERLASALKAEGSTFGAPAEWQVALASWEAHRADLRAMADEWRKTGGDADDAYAWRCAGKELRAALDAWTAHRADLDTLEQQGVK